MFQTTFFYVFQSKNIVSKIFVLCDSEFNERKKCIIHIKRRKLFSRNLGISFGSVDTFTSFIHEKNIQIINIAIIVSSSRSEQSFPPGVAYLHISLWLFGKIRACSPRGRSQGITTALAAIFINFIVIIRSIDIRAGSCLATIAIGHDETCEIADLHVYFGRDVKMIYANCAALTMPHVRFRTLLFVLSWI